MRKPNLDKWCDKFLTAVQKCTPPMETRLSPEQMTALCMSVLRPYIQKRYGTQEESNE